MIKAVFFDIGETLIDESRDWNEWADHLEVPRRVFHALLGAVIARGQHHRRVFDLVRPGVDFAASCREREATGSTCAVTAKDIYPDVVPCLKRLRETGVLVGIAGNQPVATERALRTLGVPADIVASSASWCVDKPDAPLFRAHRRRDERNRAVQDCLHWRPARQRCGTGAAGRHGSSVLAARPMGNHSVRFRADRVSRARDRQPFRASGVTVRKFGDVTLIKDARAE